MFTTKLVVTAVAILYIIIVSILNRMQDGTSYKSWKEHEKAINNIFEFRK